MIARRMNADTPDEDLWVAYRVHGDQSARTQLVSRYMSSVNWIVGQVARKVPLYFEIADLRTYGLIGLLDAIEKFDYNRGLSFKTYLVQRVRGSIYDGVRSEGTLPRGQVRKFQRMHAVTQELACELNRHPTREEIAHRMYLSESKLRVLERLVEESTYASLDVTSSIEDGYSLTYKDCIRDDRGHTPEWSVVREETCDRVRNAIAYLPKRLRWVVHQYYYEDMNLKEIALVLKVTESRVSQLKVEAEGQIRSILEHGPPKPKAVDIRPSTKSGRRSVRNDLFGDAKRVVRGGRANTKSWFSLGRAYRVAYLLVGEAGMSYDEASSVGGWARMTLERYSRIAAYRLLDDTVQD